MKTIKRLNERGAYSHESALVLALAVVGIVLIVLLIAGVL
jgi:hypothetical protein